MMTAAAAAASEVGIASLVVVSSLCASIRRRLDFRGLMTHPALPPPAPTRKMKEGNESEYVQYKQVLQAPVS